VRRVSIVGNSGSGKTTLGRELGGRLGVPFLELDSVFHQPNWTPLERDEFRRQVQSFIDEHPDGWVLDGNYSAVRDLVWAHADTVVWLDLSRAAVMRRVVGRTLRRKITREELWNGNREPLSNFVSLRMEENIIIWSWKRHRVYRERYGAAATDPTWAHLDFIRVRDGDDRASLVAGAAPQR
jgi:adenylate kinase family enzyme